MTATSGGGSRNPAFRACAMAPRQTKKVGSPRAKAADLVSDFRRRREFQSALRPRHRRRRLLRGRAAAGLVLLVDPLVRLLHPVAELGVRLPAVDLAEEGVVAVAAVHALGGVED